MSDNIETNTNQNIDEKKLRRIQSLEAASRLAGGVIHDLNNKLMIINANIDLVSKQVKSSPAITRKLLAALVASEQAGQIVTQMMSLFNPKDTSPRYVKISDNLISVAELLRRSLISRNIQVEISIADETPTVAVDIDEFQAAIVNLVVRISDVMPDGGRILIEAKPVVIYAGDLLNKELEGKFIRISISGVVFSDSTNRHESDSTNRRKVGLDEWNRLDLLQVREFIEESSGVIQFEESTEHNYDAALYLQEVNIPVILGGEEPIDEFSSLSEIPVNNRSTLGSEILIVDDEVEVALALQSVVKKIGYAARIAIGAREAASAIADKRPSMVLSDIAMRGNNGIVLAREIHAVYPNLPIVLLTGDQRLVQADVEFPLLTKPISSQRLAVELHRNLLEGVKKNVVPISS